jgi:hypothetical protein
MHPASDLPQGFQLDAVSYAGLGICLFALAGWLYLVPQQTSGGSELLEVSGRLEHASDWKPTPRASPITVLQVSASRIRVTTDRVSSSELQRMMQSPPVEIRAKVRNSYATQNEKDPLIPARALWIDGKIVLTLEDSDASDKSSSRFATLFAVASSFAGFYFLLKAYALHRARVEA